MTERQKIGRVDVRRAGHELLADPAAAEQLKRAYVALQRRAERARTDVKAFFEFVMREEKGNAKIKLMPHQRVFLDFVMHHRRSLGILAVEHSKTWLTIGLTLFMLGQDPTLRGAFVSATQAQSQKVLHTVKEYLTTSREYAMVFPNVVPEPNAPWTDTQITIKRPPGMKDPTLAAYGLDSKAVIGSRVDWLIGDDLLNEENTGTREQRDKVDKDFHMKFLSRLDQARGKAIVINSPWDNDDLLHRLEGRFEEDGHGWASMRMSIDGDVSIKDDQGDEADALEFGLPWEPWDHDELRPRTDDPDDEVCRLVAHDPDPDNEIALWPESFTPQRIAKLQHDFLPEVYNRLFRVMTSADDERLCKWEYLKLCLKLARDMGVFGFVDKYEGPNLTFTGVDLAFGKEEIHDSSVIFTFEQLPNGMRRILEIQVGRWDAPTTLDRIFDAQVRYNSLVRVENNAGQQMLIEFGLARNRSMPLYAHTTTQSGKLRSDYALPVFFNELRNGAWLIPNGPRGERSPTVKKLIKECLDYKPEKHTGDILMACLFARAQASSWGLVAGQPVPDRSQGGGVDTTSR